MTSKRLLLLAPLLPAIYAQSLPTTSIFVPVEYVSNTFSASVAGADATATTYIFPPGCEGRPCGPVTVIQGPGTALFNETDQPLTTIYNCTLYPSTGDPTSASCTLSSTSPGAEFPDPVTMTYPQNSGDAFPLYKAVVTAGDTSDIWGSQTTNSRRASLFNPLSQGSVIETGTATTTSASPASSSSGVAASATSMPLSTASATATTTIPESASLSATETSASATSKSGSVQSVMPLGSLLLAGCACILVAVQSVL